MGCLFCYWVLVLVWALVVYWPLIEPEMKMNEELYTRIDHADGRIEFIPKPVPDCDFVPVGDMTFWHVGSWGNVDRTTCLVPVTPNRSAFFNMYPTEKLARKAAELMRSSNAIIRACLLVDPDYTPEWGGTMRNYSVYYNYDTQRWGSYAHRTTQGASAYVSTPEKAEQVINLLKKWGVK
jgi:hypothetical protein